MTFHRKSCPRAALLVALTLACSVKHNRGFDDVDVSDAEAGLFEDGTLCFTVKCNVSAQLTREEDRVCSLTVSYE